MKKRSVLYPWKEALCIAFSMYSRIPMPQVSWTDGGMKYALCFFPLVGAALGAAVSGYCRLAVRLSLGPVAFACLGTAIPLIVTGGIHMDGFLDTVDALSSCQARERKLEILKDPHVGAFGVIGCGVYLLLYAAVFSELGPGAFPKGAGVFVASRALSGWAVVTFPKAKKDGLASTFSGKASHRAVRFAMAGWLAAAGIYTAVCAGIEAGVCLFAAGGCVLWWYRRMAGKEFGGVTGDLAGFFLQVCELVMLAAFVALP